MILLKNLRLVNYRNIKNISLKDFGDLNIFVGPNNCGKSSILNSIKAMENIYGLEGNIGPGSFGCDFCEKLHINGGNDFKIFPIESHVQFNDQRLRENKVDIFYEYSPKIIECVFHENGNKVSRLVVDAVNVSILNGKIERDKLFELTVTKITEHLKDKFNLSKNEYEHISTAIENYLFRRNSVSINFLLNPGDPSFDHTNSKINAQIHAILPNIPDNFNLDDSSLKNIFDEAKKEYFSLHVWNEVGKGYNPLFTLILKQKNEASQNTVPRLRSNHFSLVCISDITNFISNSIWYFEDDRLRMYKLKNLDQYIRDKNLSGKQIDKLIKFIGKIIDPRIEDYTQNTLDLIRNDGFVTPIAEQGSGVRSLICLATDILSTKENNILLMDEPELGLNPSAKKEFLKFLIEESKSKQIFITTHDPTFVNPTIWNEYETKTSVYLYSLKDEMFKKVDLKQNNVDPSTFGGYLPHTTSLKKIHIYVEGASDVYTFQEFLRKYLINKGGHWAERWNNIGIYHLNGDNWQHMLYTLPKHPYQCVVVLDGDKKESAMSVCKKYNKLMNHQDFEFCLNGLDDLKRILLLQDSNGIFPVYCLEKETIEDYFREYIKDPDEHNKVKDNPEIARNMENIPEEFERIFELITSKLK